MVPRMIAAGKVSATTIDRSRTTTGYRGSAADARHASGRVLRGERVEVQLGDDDAVLARRAARLGDRRRELPDEPDGRPAGHDAAAALAGRPAGTPRAGSKRSRHVERRAQLLDNALDVEEVDLAPARLTSAPARPVPSTRARQRGSRRVASLKRAPISNSATSRRPWRRLCATASTRPGRSDGRSVSNLADSGLASATDRGRRPARTRRAAAASMKPNVTASEKPAAVSTRRTSPSRGDSRVGGRRRRRERRERRLELVEPVMAADFLDEIDLALQIDPKRGSGDFPAVGHRGDAEPERRENPHDLAVGHLHAQQPAAAWRAAA